MMVMLNRATKDTLSFLKILFSALKNKKKKVYGNDEKILPSDLKKCPRSNFLKFEICPR